MGLNLVVNDPIPQEYATMRERNDSTLALPATSSQDVLTGLLRQGAQRMLAQAIDAEVAEWIEAHHELRDAAGHRQVVPAELPPEDSLPE